MQQQASYRIIGIEDSDGQACECCGTRCPKRRVVLERDGDIRYFGSSCAAMALIGDKSRKAASMIERRAMARTYAATNIAKYGNGEDVLKKIANGIRLRYCEAWIECGKLIIA